MDKYREEKYRLLVEETGTAVFEWDLVDESFECTDSFYNYALSDLDVHTILSNEGPLDMVYPDDRPALFAFFKDSEKLPKAETVLRLKMKDGTFRWSHMSGIFVKDENGQKTRVIGIISDIDEDKQKTFMTEELLNVIPGGIAILRITPEEPIFKCLYFSDGFAAMSGHSRESIDTALKKGSPLYNVVYSADRERFLSTWLKRSAKGLPVNMLYRCNSIKGELYWTHMSATKIKDVRGCPVYYAVFTQPSDEALLYRTLVEGSSTATFVAEKASRNILYVNNAWKTMEGIDQNATVVGESLFSLISKEQYLLSQEQVDTLPEKTFNEFHVKRNDGKCLFVHARSIMWNDIPAYILYLADETTQCLQQEQLESSRSLLDAAMTNAHVSAWELDIPNRTIIQTALSQKIHGFDHIVPNIPEALLADDYTSPQTAGELKRLYDEVYSGMPSQADVQFDLPVLKATAGNALYTHLSSIKMANLSELSALL